MTKDAYIKRMKAHEARFEKLWTKIVQDTNRFIVDNPNTGIITIQHTSIEGFANSLCLSGVWIRDRIDKKSGIPGNSNYKGSLTKKIRKALGYTL